MKNLYVNYFYNEVSNSTFLKMLLMKQTHVIVLMGLFTYVISILSLHAQVPANSTIIFEEEWEAATADMIPAGWTGEIDQSTTFDEGWVVGSGPSSINETGPNTANAGDQYMYFESGSPAGPDAMADLISPSIAINGTNPTLSFALYMYGSDLKMLEVSVIHDGGTTALQTYTTQLQSSKTESWAIQTFDLSAYDGQTVQILFAAQKMNVGLGDIAIDSVTIYTQSATELIPTLSQWGMIFLGLSLLIIIVVAKAAENQKTASYLN